MLNGMWEHLGYWLRAPSTPVAPRPTIVKVLVGLVGLVAACVGGFTLVVLVSAFTGGGVCLLIFVVLLGLVAIAFAGAARGLWIGDPEAPAGARRFLSIFGVLPTLATVRIAVNALTGDSSMNEYFGFFLVATIVVLAPLILLRIRSVADQVDAFVQETQQVRAEHRLP